MQHISVCCKQLTPPVLLLQPTPTLQNAIWGRLVSRACFGLTDGTVSELWIIQPSLSRLKPLCVRQLGWPLTVREPAEEHVQLLHTSSYATPHSKVTNSQFRPDSHFTAATEYYFFPFPDQTEGVMLSQGEIRIINYSPDPTFMCECWAYSALAHQETSS